MEKEVYGYIYKIRNTVNEKVYIGLTKNGFDERYKAKGEGIERVYNYHTHQKENRRYYNEHLLRSIEKYGFEAFEVIKEFDIAYSEEELKEKEKYWISFYKSNDANYGYNKTEGGDGVVGLKGKEHPMYKGFVVIYENGKVSEVMTGDEVANYLNVGESMIMNLAREKTCYIGNYERIRYIRVLHLEDYLKEQEIYKSNEDFKNMCKQMVEEAKILYEKKKEEFREVCRGHEVSEETRKRLREAGKGHEVSEETRRKIGEANRGREVSEETRKRLREANKATGIKHGQAKLVVAIFPDDRVIKDVCMKELAKELGISIDTIRSILYSKQPYKAPNRSDKSYLKQFDGMIIMYQEDYLNIIENKYCKFSKAS